MPANHRGLLTVAGAISLQQLWPRGSSDADTTKVLVHVDDGAFRFCPRPGAEARVTHAFDGARVRGRATHPVLDGNGRVTIRLQAIDAPELHYEPQPARARHRGESDPAYEAFLKLQQEYRQPWGEAAAARLGAFLAKGKKDPLPCTVQTRVEEPTTCSTCTAASSATSSCASPA